MCFSATASFVGAAAIAVPAAAGIANVVNRRQLPLALLPVGFAFHQATEGIVWLGLDEHVSRAVMIMAAHVYALFALPLLPMWVPLALLVLETHQTRRRLLQGATAGGVLLSVYLLVVALRPIHPRVQDNSIAYHFSGGNRYIIAVYLVATCFTLFVSSYGKIALFGVLNLVGVALAAWMRTHEFSSVWCAWAAIMSTSIAAVIIHQKQSGTSKSITRYT